MAWLLRLVIVLADRAAGSAENVTDMKAVVFNPLTLCAPYRLLHIASTVNADGGPLTNSSAGCAIVLRRRRFSEVCFPPDALAGRGGAIIVKAASGDFLFDCQYTPPISGTKGKMQTCAQLSKWAQETPSAVPARSFIAWGGDFNSGFGLHQDGTRWDKGVGDANLKCPKLSKEVRDHVPIFLYLHCYWFGSWKSFQVEARETCEPESVHLRPVADDDGDAVARAVRCLLGPSRYSQRPGSSSCICVRCFGFLDLSTRFCHMCGHPELEAVPDTFHGQETVAHTNVSCCEALRSQDEEVGNVFWGWARSTSAQIKAAASLENSGGLALEGRALPCRKPGEAPEQLGGRDVVGLATFSRTELLVQRGTAVRNSDGAAPSKFVGSIIHTVALTVSDPSFIWKMKWKLISNSKK